MKTKLLILSLAICTLANAQYTKLLDFAYTTSGSNPYGNLFSDGTFLYGMTYQGGANVMGVLFKIKPDGTGYNKLLDFGTVSNGSNPQGSLISDGTFLYGMATGGANGKGIIFKIMPDGSGYVDLHDFGSVANDGNTLEGTLFYDGTFLYGMTRTGGTNNLGTIFKIMPDGTGYLKLLNFAGSSNGQNPDYGALISDGTFLYGMTTTGGTNNLGVIFKIMPNGSGFTKLLDFSGTLNGSQPHGSLIYDGTFLYGMTTIGGGNGKGVIFKIKTDGTAFSKLYDFAGFSDGSQPYGSLFSDGNFLYGMTRTGGTGAISNGVIFKIKPDGTGYVKLLDFNGANGSYPYGSLISDGTFLYGMTFSGGANSSPGCNGGGGGCGTLFKYKYTCTASITGNTTICTGQNATLTASGGTSYLWNTNSTSTSIVISPTTNTSYTVTATNSNNGCTDITTTSVTVNPTPSQPTITNSGGTTFCQGNNVTLTSSSENSYLWSNGATTQSIVVTSSGNYSVTVTNTGGCSASSTITSITVYPPPVTITANGATTFCQGNSVTLTTSSSNSYLWSNSATTQSINVSTSGNYSVTVTDANGCSATSSPKIVTVNPLPAVTANASATTVCAGASVTIIGGGATSYTWSSGITNGVGFISTSTATYTVTGTNGSGCSNTSTVAITVNPIPTPAISGSTIICIGDVTTLTASGGITYSWNTSSTTSSIVMSPTTNTSYIVTATNGSGCTAVATISVTVNPLPATPTINVNMSTLSSSSSTGNQWLLNGNPINGATSQFYNITQNGFYSVCVTDANGCSSCSAPYNFTTTGIMENNIANSISVYPNPNSGTFTITTKEKEYSLIISNLLGEKILSQQISNSLPLGGQGWAIDLSNHPNGIYFLTIKTNQGTTNQKLIINH